MFDARVLSSIEEVGREAWDACFAGVLEGYDYLAAVEGAGLAGFHWRYVVVEERHRIVAAAPFFCTDYCLATTLTKYGRLLVAATRRLAPRAFTVRMACLGSPCTENVGLGFVPDLPRDRRTEVLERLLHAFEGAAAQTGSWLLAIKDAPERDDELWAGATKAVGYQPTPGMPSATLAIDFADLDDYLATLSYATRKDMRRKLKTLDRLRIEIVHDLTALEPRITELYRQTRERADLQFEDLTAAYFTGVLRRMEERSLCVLYWADEELIGFNLLLQDETTLLDKVFCMDGVQGAALNLYFVSWFTNVRLCLERGLTRYQSGQAAYETKLRLGSRLIGANMYFRHRRPLVNRALQLAAPLLADDPVPRRGAA